jgi:hypothetical protein
MSIPHAPTPREKHLRDVLNSTLLRRGRWRSTPAIASFTSLFAIRLIRGATETRNGVNCVSSGMLAGRAHEEDQE